MTQSISSSEHFDSLFMTMTQAFQELLSIAAKAETDSALVMLMKTVETMTQQLDSAYDSHVDSSIEDESTTPIVSQTPIDSTNQIDSDADTRKPFDSEAIAYIKKQLTRLNVITKNIAEGKDGVKRMSKETKLKFIEEAFNHYEMLSKFVTDSYKDSDLLETANFQAYVQSKQQILITCYDNVAISN